MEQVNIKIQYTDRNIEFVMIYKGTSVIVHTASLEGLDMGDVLAYIKQHRALAMVEAMAILNVCAGLNKAA